MLKMTAMVLPIRTVPGRCTSTNHCRHCSAYETLSHALGTCPHGEILRIKRQNIIRSMIAQALRSKGMEIYEEVTCYGRTGQYKKS